MKDSTFYPLVCVLFVVAMLLTGNGIGETLYFLLVMPVFLIAASVICLCLFQPIKVVKAGKNIIWHWKKFGFKATCQLCWNSLKEAWTKGG